MSDILPTNQPPTRLTPAGQTRSEHILADLQSTLGRAVRRDRAIKRTTAALSLFALAATAAWLLWPQAPSAIAPAPRDVTKHEHAEPATPPYQPDRSPPAVATNTPPAISPTTSPIVIRIFSTKDEVLAPCNTVPTAQTAPSVCVLDDKQLLSALAETGGNYGLVRVNGRALIVKDGQPLTGRGG